MTALKELLEQHTMISAPELARDEGGGAIRCLACGHRCRIGEGKTLRQLEAVAKDGSKPFYGEETLGKTKYFTAIYPDKAVAQACVTCHNEHKDTPKKDFKMGQTMGGVVLRIPMK